MSDFKQLTAYTNVKCKCVAPTLPPCDLLAKCDWHGDELRVELPQWPEVMTVWVNGKAMPFAPVTTDLAEEIRSKVEAWSEVAELEGTIECLKGLAEANYERCDTCEAMLDCDECMRADASHKELRGLQAELKALRELVRDMWFWHYEGHIDNVPQEEQTEHIDGVMRRMRKLGVEL